MTGRFVATPKGHEVEAVAGFRGGMNFSRQCRIFGVFRVAGPVGEVEPFATFAGPSVSPVREGNKAQGPSRARRALFGSDRQERIARIDESVSDQKRVGKSFRDPDRDVRNWWLAGLAEGQHNARSVKRRHHEWSD